MLRQVRVSLIHSFRVGIFIGVAIPVVVFLFFLVLPKKRLIEIPEDQRDPSSPFLVKVIICFIIFVLGFFYAITVFGVSELLAFVEVTKMDSATEKLQKFERNKEVDSDDELDDL
jgi:hypothetical protein